MRPKHPSAVFVRAIFPGEAKVEDSNILQCRFGVDAFVNAGALERFCFKRMTVREEELTSLTAVVAFADRSVRRRANTGWARSLHVVMPVSDPKFWQNPKVSGRLVDVLRFLSGDDWSFEFIRRRGRIPSLSQVELPLGDGQFIVMPFSGGLDSFAQARLLHADHPAISTLRLTAWNRGLGGDRDWVLGADGSRSRRVALPVDIQPPGGAEPTYRTRSFIFSVLAGLAGYMSGARKLVIPEAGQGSWGPTLVPVGAESPHRGSHPGFSRRMELFLEAVWGVHIDIEHPQQWKTKGQVLAELKKRGLLTGWEKTRSCSRDQRHLPVERRIKLHCGICAGCLLRRLSAHTAGLEEPVSNYMWEDLTAPTLDRALCKDARRTTSPNDVDIAVHAMLAMEELARAAKDHASSLRFESALIDAYGEDDKESLKKGSEHLSQLLLQHNKEWKAFTQQLGAHSWINQQIGFL
jgi:hypothetical protein